MLRNGGYCSNWHQDESCCGRGRNPGFTSSKRFRSYQIQWARVSCVPGDAHGPLGWQGLNGSLRTHLKWVLVQAHCWDGPWALLTWV